MITVYPRMQWHLMLFLQGAQGFSPDLLTQRGYCGTVAHFYWSRNTLLPVQSKPSSDPTSHEYHSASSLIFRSWYRCAHVRQNWGGKRGECLRERESQLQCVIICVWGWNRERGVGGCCYLSCRVAHCIWSLSCQIQLELPAALSCLLSEWMKEWMGCQEEMLAEDWLMRAGTPVWMVTPRVRTTTSREDLGRLAFPRQL